MTVAAIRQLLLLALVVPTIALAGRLPMSLVAATEPFPPGLDAIDAAETADGWIAATAARATGPIWLSVSTDRGRTWTERTPPGSGGHARVAATMGGILDSAWISSDGLALEHRRSVDGGVTWGPTRSIQTATTTDWFRHAGGMRLATSPGGHLAVVGDFDELVQVFTSVDGGVSWYGPTALTFLTSSTVEQHPAVTWLDDGELVACWHELSKVRCRRSASAGVGFEPPVNAAPFIRGGASLSAGSALGARGPNDVILAFTDDVSIQVVRSTNGGRTWSPATMLVAASPAPWMQPDLAAHATGEVWVTSRTPGGGVYEVIPPDVKMWTTGDGSTWLESPLPPDIQTCAQGNATEPTGAEPPSPRVLSPAWRQPLIIDGNLSWLASPTLGFEEPVPLAAAGAVVHDAVLIEAAAGRLVAFWSEGTTPPVAIRASASDDAGRSWSPSTLVNDAYPSLPNSPDQHHISATAAADGGIVTAWLARVHGACSAEVRVSRADDTLTFGPSQVLGSATALPASVAADGSGRMVVAWVDEDLMVARSTDGGRSWSPASAIMAPKFGPGLGLVASELARNGDGELVVLTTHSKSETVRELWASVSSDGGVTWSEWLVGPVFTDSNPPVLVAAGPRLRALTRSGAVVRPNHESSDGGRSWVELTSVPRIPPTERAVGDVAGNFYWIRFGQLRVTRPSGVAEDLGPLEPSSLAPVLLARGLDQVATLSADWELRDSGLYYGGVCASAAITTPPASRIACGGESVTLAVTSSGAPGHTYQWSKDGIPVPGATSASHTIPGVVGADSGQYTCTATAPDGCEATSPAATLWVFAPPPPVGPTLMMTRAGGGVVVRFAPVPGVASYELHSSLEKPFTTTTLRATRADPVIHLDPIPDDLIFFRAASLTPCGVSEL